MLTALVIALVLALFIFGVTRTWWAAALAFVFDAFLVYTTLPVIRLDFWDLFVLLAVNLAFCAFIIISRPKQPKLKSKLAVLGAAGAIWLLYGVVGWLSSAPILRAEALRSQIGAVNDTTEYNADTAPISVADMRTVDPAYARNLAEKRLGADRGLGSLVNLGEGRLQVIDGREYWVFALNHASFGRWLGNRSGTTGYIRVAASNAGSAELVQQDSEGTPLAIRYNQGAYFGDDPQRYLWNHGLSRVGLTDFSFEIQDQTGRPYWVVTEYEHAIGMGAPEAIGVALLDAQTGEIERYSIDEAPAWVDRIQPMWFVQDQLDQWGRYVDGWWKAFIGSAANTETSEGMTAVLGTDGRVYYYTGMTSTNSDEATVGFTVTDSRTKATRFYSREGATERAAQRQALSLYAEMSNIRPAFPLLYNVEGVPTYFMPIKNTEGNPIRYAFVNVRNYDALYGRGETIQEAYRDYRRRLITGANAERPSEAVGTQTYAEGTVARWQAVRQGDNLSFYFTLTGNDTLAFIATAENVEAILSGVGDTVAVAFLAAEGEQVVQVSAFDNRTLGIRPNDATLDALREQDAARKAQAGS